MFLSRLRVLSFSSPRVLKTTFYVCGDGSFFGLWPKIRPNGKSTKLSSDRHILLFGSVRCLHYVVSFFSIIPSTSTKGRSLFAFVSSRLVAIGAKRLLVLAGKEVERLYTLFARQKKKAPSSSVVGVVVVVWSLFFFITTYELYSRGLLGLLLFCSFIAFSWFKPSSRRRREESSSLVDPFSLFHSHALSFITLKKQAPSWSVDRSLLQTEDTHNLFSYIFWIK